jgi:hemoglobin
VKDTCASHDGRISEAEIHSLVGTFYTRIQSDDLLGPIFDAHVGDGWDAHLDKMCDFWSSILLATGRFRGNPIVAHQGVPEITSEGFDRWLVLFEEVASDVLSPTHTIDVVARAHRMRLVLERRIAPVTP